MKTTSKTYQAIFLEVIESERSESIVSFSKFLPAKIDVDSFLRKHDMKVI